MRARRLLISNRIARMTTSGPHRDARKTAARGENPPDAELIAQWSKPFRSGGRILDAAFYRSEQLTQLARTRPRTRNREINLMDHDGHDGPGRAALQRTTGFRRSPELDCNNRAGRCRDDMVSRTNRFCEMALEKDSKPLGKIRTRLAALLIFKCELVAEVELDRITALTLPGWKPFRTKSKNRTTSGAIPRITQDSHRYVAASNTAWLRSSAGRQPVAIPPNRFLRNATVQFGDASRGHRSRLTLATPENDCRRGYGCVGRQTLGDGDEIRRIATAR